MSLEQDYLNIQRRHAGLMQELAVMSAEETLRAAQRSELEAKLRELGVDPAHPDEEIARLEREAAEAVAAAATQLDEFESKLKTAKAVTPAATTPTAAPAAPVAEPKPAPVPTEAKMPVKDSDDIDIG